MKFHIKPNLIKRGSLSVNNSLENNEAVIKMILSEFFVTAIIIFGESELTRGRWGPLANNARFYTTFRLNSHIHFFV